MLNTKDYEYLYLLCLPSGKKITTYSYLQKKTPAVIIQYQVFHLSTNIVYHL